MHDIRPHEWIGLMWAVWLAYWIVSAGSVKSTRSRESAASRLSHVLPVVIGIGLIGDHNLRSLTRMAGEAHALHSVGSALVAVGLGFAISARWHLGRNWSAIVTIKENHELIRTGPYRWVRHPIYTGLLTAVLGTAIAVGHWRAFLGWAIIVAAFIRKLRFEEQSMRQVFGEQYTRYEAEVAALIPFLF